MKNLKQKLFTLSIVALALCGALFSFLGTGAKVREINNILRSESYAYLPESAKSIIRENYLQNDALILTEKNQILNQPYLNPEFIDYLELPAEERSQVVLIPDAFVTPLSAELMTSNLSEAGPLPASFDLRDVNGSNYTTPLKNQGDLGICWTYAAAEQAESYLLATNTVGTPTILAPRQIDYATSTDGISHFTNTEFGTRKLTGGGSFLHAAQIMAAGVSFATQDDSIYTTNGTTALPLEDVLSFSNSLYELKQSASFHQDVENFGAAEPTTADLAYRNLIKQYIMNYGGASIGTEGPQNQCGNIKGANGAYFVRVDGTCTEGNGHAMQIIGWDDTFDYTYCNVDGVHKYGKGCLGQPEITTTGDNPNAQRGAWLVRNSWGDAGEFSYLYVTYDSLRSDIDIITKLSATEEKTWDNEYSNTYIVAKGEDEYTYSSASGAQLDFTKKTDKSEKLTQIKFYALSAGKTYYIVYNDPDNFIALEGTANLPGYVTVDLSSYDIEINSDADFAKVFIFGYDPFAGSLPAEEDVAWVLHKGTMAFTENLDDDPAIYGTVDTVTPVKADKKLSFTIEYDTANIPSGESLSFHLLGSKNIEPKNPVAPGFEILNTAESNTYNFTATNTEVAYNKANVSFSMAENLKKGVYSVVAYYGADPLTEEGSDTPYTVTYFVKDDAKGEMKYALATAGTGTLSVEKETIDLLTGKLYEGDGPGSILTEKDFTGTTFTPAEGITVDNWTYGKTLADYQKLEEFPAGVIVGSSAEFKPSVIDSKFFAVYTPGTYYVNTKEEEVVFTYQTEVSGLDDYAGAIPDFYLTEFGGSASAEPLTSTPVAIKTGSALSVTASIDPSAFGKDFFAFDGWYDASGALVSSEQTFTPSKTGDTYVEATYTAKWHAITWSFKVAVNDSTYGTASYTDQSFLALEINDWYDADFATLTELTDPAGTTITPTPSEKTAQYTYAFSTWTIPAITAHSDDYVYVITANFTRTVNKYTATFENYDGTTLQETAYDYGTTPVYNGATPVRAEDDTYTYTFAGWDQTLAGITEDTTYTATFTPVYKNYTIRFEDYDSTTISEKTNYHWGETVTVPSDPTRDADTQYTYTFAGWTPTVATTVAGNATYTATYTSTLQKYTITFKNSDGTVLQESQFDYGATPVYSGQTPTKAEDNIYTYTFAGWDQAILAVSGAATYTATFTPVYRNYRIRFIVEGTTVIDKTDYHYGETVLPPLGTPTKPATAQYTYTFSGWSPAVATVTGDQDYIATFSSTVNSYTITFKNYDGTTLQSESLEYGTTPVYRGLTPVKPADSSYSYRFVGWDKDITPVTGATTYTAVFDDAYQTYTVKFISEGQTISEKTDYHYGDDLVKPSDPTKASDNTYAYTFSHWDPAVPATVTKDATFTAVFDASYIDYTIRFQDYDGSLISEKTDYHYGETIIAPSDPTRAQDSDNIYYFAGWDKTFDTVAGDQTITATYDVLPLHATFAWQGTDIYALTEPEIALSLHIDIAKKYFDSLVEVDYEEISEGVDYEVIDGSTVIVLTPAFLSTLEIGMHTLTVYFDEGVTVTTTFEVVEERPIDIPDVPNTGLESIMSEFATPIVLPFCILTVLVAIIVPILIIKKNRHHIDF